MGRRKLNHKYPTEIHEKEPGLKNLKNVCRDYSIEMACGALLASGVNSFIMYKMLRK